MAILTVENLSKNYGKIQALKSVSFSVPKGSVFGILGPNGSGKTTLLGIIMNVLKATSGNYKVFDEPATDAHRKLMGTLLETPNFYHYLSAARNLQITAAIKGHGENDIDNVLKTVNLFQRKDSPFSTYSLGMKQRLAIGAALLGNPDVLVFDEPTNGLDPVGIAEIRSLIKELSSQGKTIIMASHLLDEVEKVCTHVAILKQGDLIASGKVEDIFAHDDVVQLQSADLQKLKNTVSQISGVKRVNETGGKLEIAFEIGTADLTSINQFCFNNGIVLSHLQLKHNSIETKFLALTNALS
jgi:ABC-type multidrug transport system ATPase subunit